MKRHLKLPEWAKPFLTRKNLKIAGVAFGILTFLLDGGPLYNFASTNKFVLKSTFGNVDDKTKDSGLYFHFPFIQYTHDYRKNVQTINFKAGGIYFLPIGSSSKDNNHINAKIKLNYRVIEDTEKLGYHRWAMDGFVFQDGFWLLTGMMNASANAVMGDRTAADTMGNPKEFLRLFREDFNFRLEQNNVPIDIESLELKAIDTFFPTTTKTYVREGNGAGSDTDPDKGPTF